MNSSDRTEHITEDKKYGKYNYWRFGWHPDNYLLKTCEFSEDFQEMTFLEYLEKWNNKMGGKYDIIKRWFNKRWDVTLVERRV